MPDEPLARENENAPFDLISHTQPPSAEGGAAMHRTQSQKREKKKKKPRTMHACFLSDLFNCEVYGAWRARLAQC
jgi:hypothetical protein